MAAHPFRSNRVGSGFKTGATGMGHVLLDVHDCSTTERRISACRSRSAWDGTRTTA